jgi:polygalacturonase
LILDSLNLTIGQIKISVNRTAQYKLLRQFNRLTPPLFPFNTDGIDPQGSNIHIYNISCENYNDIVVVKPNSPKGRLSKCSENILVENVTSWWGSGMSIGTVAPGGDCVRNVTFRNVEMRHPFKGIYIKTYHGTNGTAVIENVVYENMQIVRPIYWSIYIGPHKDGPGCLHIDKCTP